MLYGLANQGVVETLDADGKVVATYTVAADGRVCLPVREHGRYAVYRLRIARGTERTPPLEVHWKSGKHRRILGIIRVERS